MFSSNNPEVLQGQPVTMVEDPQSSKKGAEEAVMARSSSQDFVTSSFEPHTHESGWKRLFSRLELTREDDTRYSSVLTNVDLLPVPLEKRTWGLWTCK
jgi:hypothetical protein